MGDHPWLGETTYGAVDSPGGLSMAAIVSLGGQTMATKFAVDGPGDQFWGNHRWRNRTHPQSLPAQCITLNTPSLQIHCCGKSVRGSPENK